MIEQNKRAPFSVAKDEYLGAVVRNSDVGEAGIRLAVALIVNFANREKFEATGELTAWPSQRLLSDTVQMHRARVDRAAKALEQAGLLSVLRPDKPGPGKNNFYTMIVPTGLAFQAGKKGSRNGRVENLRKKAGPTDEASSRDNWSHNHVASSDTASGPTHEASAKPELVPSVGPELAPRVGPNSLEEPLDGAGALCARPAPTTDQGCSSVIEEDHLMETDAKAECGSEALEEPLAASPDPSDPDAWRSDPAYASDYADVASEGDDDVDPKACGGHNDTRASATLDDLERWAREETSAQPDDEGDDCPESNEDAAGRAPKCAASDAAEDDQFGDENRFAVAAYNAARSVGVDDLAAIYDAPDVDLEKHIDDAADGLSGGDPAAAFRFSRDLRLLLQQIAPTRREAVRAAHLKVITTFIAAVGGGRPYAERVIADFLRSEGQNKMEVHNG